MERPDSPPPQPQLVPLRGRGAQSNPDSRFSQLRFESEPDNEAYVDPEDLPPDPLTQFIPDRTRSILASNDSPDVGFDTSLNPYRGCEHGCIYCYARPTHEFLDYSAGRDFETKILVKYNAPELLRAELLAPRWRPRVVGLSGVTDCYQPIERKLRLTRGCLETFADFRNPVVIVTKSHTVTRDIDVLAELARHQAVAVFISVTTLDNDLARLMEPRASRPVRRLAAIRELSAAGIPVGVLVAPIIPGLTDHEGAAILKASREAGASVAGWTMLRLPYGVSSLFEEWLEMHFPLKKEKVLSRIRDVRGGNLNSSQFGTRMTGEGEYAEQVTRMLRVEARRLGFAQRTQALSTAAFRRIDRTQPELFGE